MVQYIILFNAYYIMCVDNPKLYNFVKKWGREEINAANNAVNAHIYQI